MANLGIKRKEMWGGGCMSEPAEKKDYENEIVYPCLDLQGPQVSAAGLQALEFGDEVTFTIKARVSRVGGQSAEKETPSMAFDVLSLEAEEADEAGSGLAGAYGRAVKKSSK